MGKTSSKVKEKYNKKTYKQYKMNVRMDEPLFNQLESFQETNPQGLSALIKRLLTEYFENN